jgi:hypothetical protein
VEASAHDRRARAGQAEGAAEIDVEHVLPVLVGQLPHDVVACDPGAVDERVGGQPAALERRGHGADRRRVPDVEHVRGHAIGPRKAVAVLQVERDDARARVRERRDNRAADARGAARHPRGLA